jgi:hypothetical protein
VLSQALDFLHIRTGSNSRNFVTKFYSLQLESVSNDTGDLESEISGIENPLADRIN